jgi:hypothetical protein
MKRRGFLRNRSLSYKLLVGTLSVLSVYITVIGILAYLSVRDSIAESYDQSLIVNANALLFIMQEGRGKADSINRSTSIFRPIT